MEYITFVRYEKLGDKIWINKILKRSISQIKISSTILQYHLRTVVYFKPELTLWALYLQQIDAEVAVRSEGSFLTPNSFLPERFFFV